MSASTAQYKDALKEAGVPSWYTEVLADAYFPVLYPVQDWKDPVTPQSVHMETADDWSKYVNSSAGAPWLLAQGGEEHLPGNTQGLRRLRDRNPQRLEKGYQDKDNKA